MAGDWQDLPALRVGATPKWPLGRCTPAMRGLWQRLWRTPQAALWEPLGLGTQLSVARYVTQSVWVAQVMAGEVQAGQYGMAQAIAELRQLEDRLGLSPKGAQERRWRPSAPSAASASAPAGVAAMVDYRARLRPAAAEPPADA